MCSGINKHEHWARFMNEGRICLLRSLDFSVMARKSQIDKMTKHIVKIILNRNEISPGSFSISEGFLLNHSFCLLTEDDACISAGSATLLRWALSHLFWLEAVSTARLELTSSEVKIRVARRGQLALPAMPHSWASGDAKTCRDDPKHIPWAKGLLFLVSDEALPLEFGLTYFCSQSTT